MGKENIRSEAYQLSELLLNDAGEPASWNDPDSAKRIGLSYEGMNRSNLLSYNKITNLNSFCNGNYNEFLKKINFNKPFSVKLNEINSDGTRTNILNCAPPVLEKTKVNATVRRVTSYYDGSEIKIGELIIEV